MKPLCIDLFCGLGGWAQGFLAEGYDVVGFDIEARQYPGQLVLQDVLTLHGFQFKHADVIVASPPCQKYSYMAMPWKLAKALAVWHREDDSRVSELTALFRACFRIQREACEAAGRYIPMVVENVKGAQPWVGKAKAHYGSFYLWGDVESVGEFILTKEIRFGGPKLKVGAGSVKVSGMNWSGSDKPGYVAQAFNGEAAKRFSATKNEHVGGGSWFNIGSPGQRNTGRNPDRAIKGTGGSWFSKVDGKAVCSSWRDGGCVTRLYNSKDPRRKQVAAEIAMIPFPLANYIAAQYRPTLAQIPSTLLELTTDAKGR